MRAFEAISLQRFLLLLVLSAALMITDHRSTALVPLRVAASTLNLPFHWLFNLPARSRELIDTYYPDGDLSQRHEDLRRRYTEQSARLLSHEQVLAENRRLAKLLEIQRDSKDNAMLAGIVEVGLDALTHRVALNRGAGNGLYRGQPVITLDGVLGQVSMVGHRRSVVTLLTDPSHALPVHIQRNGLRAIARGLGVVNRVEVPFLSAQADIRTGDVLVTSGLGGGFPPGYKVARVERVVTDANEAFLAVTAITFADIEITREALLLIDNAATAATDATTTATADSGG